MNEQPSSNLDEAIDLQKLMSKVKRDKRWIYRGSFTTPPALEGVLWHVIDDVQFIPQETLDKFLSSKSTHPRGDNRC